MLIQTLLSLLTAIVFLIWLSMGPVYADEQTFDYQYQPDFANGQAAATDESPERPGPDESPDDYLYAHYANAAQIDCLIAAESRWTDIGNAQGSGAIGYGQYMPATWRRYQAESDRWDANPHDVYDVFDAMAWDLARGRRSQWAVRGC